MRPLEPLSGCWEWTPGPLGERLVFSITLQLPSSGDLPPALLTQPANRKLQLRFPLPSSPSLKYFFCRWPLWSNLVLSGYGRGAGEGAYLYAGQAPALYRLVVPSSSFPQRWFGVLVEHHKIQQTTTLAYTCLLYKSDAADD